MKSCYLAVQAFERVSALEVEELAKLLAEAAIEAAGDCKSSSTTTLSEFGRTNWVTLAQQLAAKHGFIVEALGMDGVCYHRFYPNGSANGMSHSSPVTQLKLLGWSK